MLQLGDVGRDTGGGDAVVEALHFRQGGLAAAQHLFQLRIAAGGWLILSGLGRSLGLAPQNAAAAAERVYQEEYRAGYRRKNGVMVGLVEGQKRAAQQPQQGDDVKGGDGLSLFDGHRQTSHQ